MVWRHVPFKFHTYKFRSQATLHSAKGNRAMHFLRDETAATAIEYGLIAAGISLAIIVPVVSVGTSVNATFTSVEDALN